MANLHLIPPIEYIRSNSSAELKVAKILVQLEAENNDVAYHSVHLPEHAYKRMSEIDFVVLWKGVVIVLEIKGGRVRSENGVWYFKDRYGNEKSRSESPWEQGRSAMFAMRARVEEALPGQKYEYSTIVVMPDQSMSPTLEWTATEYIGPNQMTVDGFRNALDKASRKLRGDRPVSAMPAFAPLKRFLRPDFDRLPSLSQIGQQINTEMAIIADEQVSVLDGVELNERILVEGGAGSGKTLLALEAARRAASAGSSVLFVCSSRAIIDMANVSVLGSGVNCCVINELPESIFDIVVVDEGQDLANVDDLAALDLRIRGGLTGGKWWFFADPNNQAHVLGNFDVEIYDDIRRQATIFRLHKNHRNTKPIVDNVKQLLGADLGTPRIGAGPAVRFFSSRDQSAQLLDLNEYVESLLDGGVALEEINFVSLANDLESSIVYSAGVTDKLKVSRAPERNRAQLWRPSEIKGLEVDHVIVIDVKSVEPAGDSANLYVAMTRAKVSLGVGLSKAASDELARSANERLFAEMGRSK